MRKFFAYLLLTTTLLVSEQGISSNAGEAVPIVFEDFTTVGLTSYTLAERAKLLVSARLSESGKVSILERENLGMVVQERTLAISTESADGSQRDRTGVTGAQYLLGGSILENGFALHFFCKLVNVDDGTMQAFTISGDDGDSLSLFAKKVTKKLLQILQADATNDKPPAKTDLTRVAALAEKLKAFDKPAIMVSIDEEHLFQPTIDPAAETEFLVFSAESGFPVIDKDPKFTEFVDILITGEGFSEVSYRQASALGITARLEVKAIDTRTGRVLAVDRQTSVALSSSELIGSKNALAKASASIAERMLPKLVKQAK